MEFIEIEGIQVLPIQIISENEFFDYNAKYKGQSMKLLLLKFR